MKTASRVACLLVCAAVALVAPAAASAAPAEKSNNGMRYKVLVFTNPADGRAAANTPAVRALRALGHERRFVVVATNDPAKLAEEDLSEYRAVIFLNTSTDVLDDAGQEEFEEYFRNGGGFVGVGTAIESEPG